MFGLLGGTFDPIHLGHLHLASQLAGRYPFATIAFVPARQNPLKEQSSAATAIQRLEMVRLALADFCDPRFRVLDWEILGPGPSYTLHTVERCEHEGISNPTLVLGNDVFESFPRWHEPRKILRRCNLIVASRNPVRPTEIEKVLGALGLTYSRQDNRFVFPNSPHWVDLVHFDALPYSASQVRADWARFWEKGKGAELPQGVTNSVSAYIKTNGLYAVKERAGS